MQTATPTPAAIDAFQSFYLAELDSRVQRSEVVGAITLKKGSAALFFEATEGKFTLVEKMPDVAEANVFDCVPREQWGRTVMLFGHATNTGGYIASGHATHRIHRASESPLSRKRRVRGPDRRGS